MDNTRGQQALPRWLQRSLAAGALTLLCGSALYATGFDWPRQLLNTLDLGPNLIRGSFLMALAALLRPWSLLMRLWQPLAPRFAAMGLLCPSPLVLLQRDALAQALGWTTAACLGIGLMAWLPMRLAPRLIGSTLEGLAPALSLAAALLVSLPLGLWLQGLPRRWARARLAGARDGAATSDALTLAANLMLLLPCLLVLWVVFGNGGLPDLPADATMLQLPALLVCWALHAGLRQWLAAAPPNSAALWLAVVPPEVRGAFNVAIGAPPLDTPTLLALAHQLAGRWQLGPVTVLLPDDLPASGEHLHAAQIAGRAAALFPTLPVQLADWQQTLPSPDRWAALPLRELHLPQRWMAGAATLLLQPGDRLLVLASESTDVAAWQPLLLRRAGRVLRLGAPGTAAAGATVATGERSTARLKSAALALLQPLRPQPQTVATPAPTDTADEATTASGKALSGGAAATAAPLGLGLPALPNQARLAAFVAGAALLALAGFVTLRLQLAVQSDAVASRYAALRLQTAALAAGAAPAQALHPASASPPAAGTANNTGNPDAPVEPPTAPATQAPAGVKK